MQPLLQLWQGLLLVEKGNENRNIRFVIHLMDFICYYPTYFNNYYRIICRWLNNEAKIKQGGDPGEWGTEAASPVNVFLSASKKRYLLFCCTRLGRRERGGACLAVFIKRGFYANI
jgi:hypothetical protein